MKGIIAYGKEEDREKLAALSQLQNISASQWIIEQIRQAYRQAYGEADPKRFIEQKTK